MFLPGSGTTIAVRRGSKQPLLVCGAVLVALLISAATGLAAAQRKDFLTGIEADKIRDAETPALRIKLFVEFAADRLKKFQYELSRPSTDRRRAERLNALLEAYLGCLDDAAERVRLGTDKQEDIGKAVKELQSKGKDFLGALERLAATGAEREFYKETLEDAVDATREALAAAEKAAREMAPPPVRRRQ